MRRRKYTIIKGVVGALSLMAVACLSAQSPHGDNFQLRCDLCHTPANWNVDPSSLAFSHDSTRFPLEGQHTTLDCRLCHTSLVFAQAPLECASCHTDIHQQSVGLDCARCHDPSSWLVNNIAQLHQEAAFPLLGAHAVANCYDCHISETDLRFDPIGTECINCHRADFEGATNPDHVAAGFSMECQQCHKITAFEWSASGFDHSFFPLTKGHDINDCTRCHTSADYTSTSPDCISCHQADYAATQNPNHASLGFGTDCASCHTTDPGWHPAKFTAHDAQYFPIYSGSHSGVWDQCTDCHQNTSDYSEFSCINCHTNPQTNNQHGEVNGYSYNNGACLACHPTGRADGLFDHNNTGFSLTGAHASTDCIDCHSMGYSATATECVACHEKDYQQSMNPGHVALGLNTDCATCHTTEPGWAPATFPVHDTYYALMGAHATIANECALCHNGDYNNTPNTCVGCHLADYNNTTEPNHTSAQFSTDCATCHNENAWQPATFDHDAQYFPIYSGKHKGEWDQCTDCHTNPANYSEYTCITCHMNPGTDNEHHGVSGYSYNSTACLACHPNGSSDDIFDHNMTGFSLTGAHTTIQCLDCHASGFAGTPTECVACHAPDFQQSQNPNHIGIGLSTDCASCHTTNPGWAPAAFPEHNNYYVLAGAHASIATECISCHQGNYNNTPNTCVGCHLKDYQATTSPNHAAEQYPTDCILCHGEAAWSPSSFDHNLTPFPLTGAHTSVDCASCHATGYTGTPTECLACHTNDFQQTQNPNHTGIGLSTDCAACHTTAGWNPAAFPVHDDYYALEGAHATIAMECALCHNGDYNNTPNSCVGCHLSDYQGTVDPNHIGAQFSTDCATCHNESAWVPATFDHDAQYFPIYSGKHEGEWTQCVDCHTNPSNYAEFTCVTCHSNPETDNAHNEVNGYVYNSIACLACHPTGSSDDNFDHTLTGFALTGAHLNVQCLDCHAAGFAGTPTECVACHTPDYQQTQNPNHVAIGLSTDCATCHTTDPDWNPAGFPDHNNYYVLEGAHALIADQCVTCHNGDYNNTPNTCVGCHLADYNATTDPNHALEQFPTECTLCHTQTAWSPATFDHDNTNFPLTGAHLTVDCASCHAAGYTGTPTDCASCHTGDYNQSTNPSHVALGLSTDCATCHTTDPGWSPAGFPVHNDYYVLEGAHALIADQCVTCHNGDYNNTPNTCVGCHLADYNATTDPNHALEQFPTECTLCHTQIAWSPATFDHDNTNFPLTGAHLTVDCASCHAAGYTGTPTDCASCHTGDYNQSTNPSHVALGLSTDCATCHTTDPGWSPAGFPVHNDYYVLEGAHALIADQCVTCHNGDYNNTPNTCVGCHLADYNATTDPNHALEQFPTECTLCHTQTAWSPATFDHDNTNFPLTGAHLTVDCASCHAAGYTGTPTDCASCHTGDYNQSTNPSHVALGLSTDCATCHTTDPGWSPAGFPVHNDYYVLEGAHALIADQCVTCHNGDYNNTPNTCVGCHLADYNATTDPNHALEQFPTECTLCHTQTAWSPATFDHDNTNFPLTGAHLTVDCASCHAAGYTGTPTDCASCHTGDYNQSTNPSHVALGLSTDCATCHTTDPGWSPAGFPVHNDYYVLEGAHALIADQCVTCHNGDYNNTPNTCVGCHLADYNNTTNPDHQAAQFPTDCTLCHSQDAWVPSTFDHDGMYFPIYSGHHHNAWDQCTDCHYNQSDYSIFTCVTCHAQGSMNNEHQGISGYVYESNACYQCHPNGNSD